MNQLQLVDAPADEQVLADQKARTADYQRAYRASNREAINAQKRAYRASNREAINAYNRAYLASNREAIYAQNRAYQASNREAIYAQNRAWYAANPERTRAKAHRRRARLLAATVEGVTVGADAIAARIDYYGGQCWICGDDYAHIDHVKPLAVGGLHVPGNLRPACKTCNLRKKAAWPFPTDQTDAYARLYPEATV